jgi:hypothetical protein
VWWDVPHYYTLRDLLAQLETLGVRTSVWMSLFSLSSAKVLVLEREREVRACSLANFSRYSLLALSNGVSGLACILTFFFE